MSSSDHARSSLASLPTDGEIGAISTAFALEPIQRLLAQVVQHCRAQTQQLKESETKIAALTSRVVELEEAHGQSGERVTAIESAARAAHTKLQHLEQQHVAAAESHRGYVGEQLETHLGGLQGAMQGVKRECMEKVHELDARLAGDGLVIREVRAAAREIATEIVEKRVEAVQENLARKAAEDRRRVEEVKQVADAAAATSTEARTFLESQRSIIETAAASLQHLREHPIVASDVSSAVARSRTAELAAAEATAAIDSLRTDIIHRVTRATTEAAAALAKAEAAVPEERFEAAERARAQVAAASTAETAEQLATHRHTAGRLEGDLARLALRIDSLVERTEQVEAEAHRNAQKIDGVAVTVDDPRAGLSAVGRAVDAANVAVVQVGARVSIVEERAGRLEANDTTNNYTVLRDALSTQIQRLDSLFASFAAIPTPEALRDRAETVASDVAQREVVRRVTEAVGEEMIRVAGVVQTCVTSAVEESTKGAEGRLRQAVGTDELPKLVDGMMKTAESLQQLALESRRIATTVDADHARIDAQAAAVDELRKLIQRAEESIVNVDARVGAPESDAPLVNDIRELREQLANAELTIRTVQSQQPAAAATLPATAGRTSGRARSPSPSSGRGVRRQKRIPPSAGATAAAAAAAAARAEDSTGSASRSAQRRVDDAIRFSRLSGSAVDEY